MSPLCAIETPTLPTSPRGELVVGVVAGLGREVERDREAGLALLEVLAVEGVRLLGGGMPGVGAHHPRPVALWQAVIGVTTGIVWSRAREPSHRRQAPRPRPRDQRVRGRRRDRRPGAQHRASRRCSMRSPSPPRAAPDAHPPGPRGRHRALVRRFPELPVYVHERGAPHLIDPSKLLKSAAQLYGDEMERLWGEVVPVPEENDPGAERRRDGRGLPGRVHARPRLAPRRLPPRGDRRGVRRRRRGRPRSRPPSSRFAPTPPPDIDIEKWLRSIDMVAAWRPTALGLTHFGRVEGDVGAHLARVESGSRMADAARGVTRGGVRRRTSSAAGPRRRRGHGRPVRAGGAAGAALHGPRALLAQARGARGGVSDAGTIELPRTSERP